MFSAPKSWPHVNNTVVLTILTFRHIQCLHLMYAEVAWVLVSSGTQVQPQVILDPDYLPDYLSVSYDHGKNLCYHVASLLLTSKPFNIVCEGLHFQKNCRITITDLLKENSFTYGFLHIWCKFDNEQSEKIFAGMINNISCEGQMFLQSISIEPETIH